MKRFNFFLIGTLLTVFLFSNIAFAQDDPVEGKNEWKHGILFWQSDNGDFAGRFDGRAFLNGAYFFEGENEMSNGTHLRKARLALKMKLWKNWYTEWDMDIAEGIVEIKDMHVSYLGFKNSEIKFGHFKVPFGLEILTSSRYIVFPERAYNALAFKMGRRMAIGYSKWGNNWNFRTAFFGQTFDVNKNKTEDETGGGAAIRAAFAPIKNDDMILHLGGAAVWERPDDNNWIEVYKAEPETKIGDVEILDTELLKNTSYTMRYGLEAALVYKSFHLQGEYQMLNVTRFEGNTDPSFSGGYVYLTWTITGESRPWDQTQGEFGQLIPKNEGGLGAWELAIRFSHLNLSDTDAMVLGGRANNYTFGVNWYPNANVVVQLNYTSVNNSENATGDGFVGGDSFSYAQFMTKFFF